ncbi:MAG: ABC transporter substrate-binding protein [Coriobacteriales bacterium]|jgi:iron complex transport system substrate-binding protein|nr:ABC transporter substrate-binding protein [Coriobacteriales bacterium]
MKKLSVIVVALLLAFGLAACAQAPGESPEADADGGASGGGGAATDVADGTADGNAAAEEQGLWPCTVTDALGREVVIEQAPQKPALIFFRNFEHMFALDVPPYAATDVSDVYKGWASLAPFAATHEIIDLGDMNAPNLEKLLEVAPDLIIVYSGVYEEIGDDLDKMATTVAVSNYGDDWQTPLKEYGKMLGKEDAAEEEIERLSTLLKEGGQELAALGDKTVACVALQSAKEFLVYNVESVYSKDAGLGLTPPAGFVEKSRETISLEGLAEFNPDYLLVYDNMTNTADEDLIAELSGSAVWNSLSAVQGDNVHLIDRSAFSGGPLSIEYGTEAIRTALLG